VFSVSFLHSRNVCEFQVRLRRGRRRENALFKNVTKLSVIFRGEPLANLLDAVAFGVDEIFAWIWRWRHARIADTTATPVWSVCGSAGNSGKQILWRGLGFSAKMLAASIAEKLCQL